ncbi:hypothetical protein, partial [Rhizobium laguerreae]|uniref:hypothetical protein n=1 Tax=Rhizobium laguerreae TaxID=1076926 RepID=UPI00197FA3E3
LPNTILSNIAGAKTSSSLAMVAPRPADHNLKAAGSNPAPATKPYQIHILKSPPRAGLLRFCGVSSSPDASWPATELSSGSDESLGGF